MLHAALLAAAFLQAAPIAGAAPEVAPAQEVAPDVYLLRGAIVPGRGPDGNTTIFRTRRGLIVVDTGRHVWHSDAILAFSRAQNRDIAAILNTHWHLDHSSGNRRLRAAFPNAPIYTTTAVDRALAEGGFLTRSLADAQTAMARTDLDPLQREEMQIFVDTMVERDALRPTMPVTRSQRMRIAGRALDVHVTDRAVTDADLWLYDRATHVAVIGDLVTLPAPFFETACPDRWSAALDEVWATPFTLAIPGHGEPMTRAQFDTYRTAFNVFMLCVNSQTAPAECASGWASGIASLEPANERLHRAAAPYAEYYVGFLREHGGKSADCLER